MKKLIFIIFFILVSPFANAQCAMCKAVVENGDNKMAEGVNSGIIYLMIFPYLFLSIGIYFLYRKYRNSK